MQQQNEIQVFTSRGIFPLSALECRDVVIYSGEGMDGARIVATEWRIKGENEAWEEEKLVKREVWVSKLAPFGMGATQG